jgi:hypothetical protein
VTSEGTTKLHFLRFEFKYVLDQDLRAAVEAELQHFVQLDPHVQKQPNHLYFVRSLYFDDAAMSAFHAKTDGMLTRSKFRVRTYSRAVDAPAPWFLEIKGRHNQLVFKHRTPILGDFDRSADGEHLTKVLVKHGQPGAVRDQFEFSVFRHGIRPVALVDYVRRPYVSRFDPDFRLTFDSSLSTCATDTMFPDPAARTRLVMRGYTVMEVKFRHHVPAWFHRILQAYELRRRSISKICESTVALGLQPADV